jgi:ABC-type phosphate/phosphonate transport system substrate-binding protein
VLSFILPPALGRAKAEARAELAEAALQRDLGEPVSVYVASTYLELETRLLSGEFSMAWAPAAVCARLPSARAVFTIVREQQTSYLSMIVGRRAQPLTLRTLQNTRAVWVDPLSVGGYLLAMARLRAEGLDPDRTFASQRFAGSHRAALDAVLHEEADVAAVSAHAAEPGRVTEMLRWYAGPAGDRLVPIAFTERCLNDAVVLCSVMPDADARRIAEKLAPKGAHSRARLLAALEAEDLARAELDDYRRLASLLGFYRPRRSSMLPPRG